MLYLSILRIQRQIFSTFFSSPIAFSTSLFTNAIVCKGIMVDNGPLGSGSPFIPLKKLRTDILKVWRPQHVSCVLTIYYKFFMCSKIFMRSIFILASLYENILTPVFSQIVVVTYLLFTLNCTALEFYYQLVCTR